MKKTLFLSIIAVFIAGAVHAGPFWSINYDWAAAGGNPQLGVASKTAAYFNADAGVTGVHNGFIAFKYDHISMDDMVLNGQNIKVVAVIPSLSLGIYRFFRERNIALSLSVNPGYAVSVRYRRGITDHKASSFSFSSALGLYFSRKGFVFLGPEIGFRMLKVKYDDLNNMELDLSGMFFGIGIKHIYE